MTLAPLYNPATADVVAGFVARKAELAELADHVRTAPEAAPQHVVVLGARGMGKTTLLHRLAALVTDDPALTGAWLPVRFDEEQFNVGSLADLWLNALLALAVGGRPSLRDRATTLRAQHDGAALEEAALRALHDAAALADRRLLLLLDNLDELLERIGHDAHARLRTALLHEPWLMVVGSATAPMAATTDYGRPLYQQLAVVELDPLDDDAAFDLLRAWAHRDRSPLFRRLDADRGRLGVLRACVGGSPRALGMLYRRWRDEPDASALDLLLAVLDGQTPTWRDTFEALPRQTQRVLDALSVRWEAATAEEIATELGLDRAPTSAHLARLLDRGLVQRVDVGVRAVGYTVRDRSLALWCLLRSGRRTGDRVGWLATWIDRLLAPVPAPRTTWDPGGGPDEEAYALIHAPPGTPADRHAAAARAHRLPADRWLARAAVVVTEARLGRVDPAALDGLLALAPPDADLLAPLLAVARVDPDALVARLDGRGDLFPFVDALRPSPRLPPERRLLADAVRNRLAALLG